MIYAVREHADKRISVVIRAADRVRLYLYGKLATAESPEGGSTAILCVSQPSRMTSRDGGYDGRQWVLRESQRHKHRGAARLRTFEGVEPMGRGRAKAKQVKVARQLKYNSGG